MSSVAVLILTDLVFDFQVYTGVGVAVVDTDPLAALHFLVRGGPVGAVLESSTDERTDDNAPISLKALASVTHRLIVVGLWHTLVFISPFSYETSKVRKRMRLLMLSSVVKRRHDPYSMAA